MEHSELRYMVLLAVFIGFFGGRLSKTAFPTSPEVIHTWEQELVWGRSDSNRDKDEHHNFGACVDIPSAGNYCFYMDADTACSPGETMTIDNVQMGGSSEPGD